MGPKDGRVVAWLKIAFAAGLAGAIQTAGMLAVRADSLNQSEPAFAARFENPPNVSRMLKIIHGWPDSAAAQNRLLQSLKDQNFGGVVCNVSFQDYLESEGRWEAFARAVKSARDAGFSMWLYDEKGYPSGTAGGIVLRNHPEWEAMGLLVAESRCSPGKPLSLALPPGEPVLAAALPMEDGVAQIAGLTNLAVPMGGKPLVWRPESGDWMGIVICEGPIFEGTHAAMSLSEHIPYPNLLAPEPTQRFLEVTHGEYARRLGTNLGAWFVSTFTDEPSLMSLFLKPMPYKVLPWGPSFAAEFQRRRGYDVRPKLPSLVVDAGPGTERTRYDYWQTVGELVSENFFGQIQKWCATHQVLSGGHLLMEENLVNQVALYGHFPQCLRRLDAPSIDCLTSVPDQVPWIIARLASGAAELEGRRFVMCETSDHSQRYRPAGDARPVRTVTKAEIRGTCNRLVVSGVNVLTSYYSFADLSDADMREVNDWIGRCCAAVTGGRSAAEVAVVVPVESLWPRFKPARHLANASARANQVESVFHEVTTSLFQAGREFTCIDAQALCEATVDAGALAHNGLRWRIVVLPGADTLPMTAWDNLARFVKAGGLVVSVANPPANSEREFPDPRVERLAWDWFGGNPAAKSTRSARAVFIAAGETPRLAGLLQAALQNDLVFSAKTTPLRHTHRTIDGQEVFFVINDSGERWRGEASFRVKGAGRRWDPATGASSSVPDPAAVAIDMPAYGAAVFTFPEAVTAPAIRVAATGAPGLRFTPLSLPQPRISGGEFVEQVLQSVASQGEPGWRAVGRLTRARVDTFLFLSFAPEKPGLEGSEFLALETAVPKGQETPAELLLILRERGGADYLAHTGRWLAMEGRHRTVVPLSRFQLAGWSKDDNARLDLSDITEMRLGWGGYLGELDERLEFTLFGVERGVSE